MVRPEQIALTPVGNGHLDATVRAVSYFGHDAVVELDGIGGTPSRPVVARVLGQHAPRTDERVGLSIAGPVRAFPVGPSVARPLTGTAPR
jgi:iron(III) transport system ATP-binding protein